MWFEARWDCPEGQLGNSSDRQKSILGKPGYQRSQRTKRACWHRYFPFDPTHSKVLKPRLEKGQTKTGILVDLSREAKEPHFLSYVGCICEVVHSGSEDPIWVGSNLDISQPRLRSPSENCSVFSLVVIVHSCFLLLVLFFFVRLVLCFLGPPVVPFYPLLGEGTAEKKGHLF